MLGVTGRGHKKRRRRLMPVVEARFRAPPVYGKRWIAELHHPYLKARVRLAGWCEAEARRQAWRHAITENLAGFKITAERIVEIDA